MHKIEKGETPDHCFRAHCFPVLNEETRDNAAEEASVPDAFQPLYKGSPADSAYRPSGIRSSAPDAKQRDDAAERRQTSYTRGIEAGQNDAHCLLQEQLAPGLREFKLAIDQFHEHFDNITRASSRYVVQLAMDIVRKILDDGLSLEDRQLAPLHQTILDAMSGAYDMSMRMNPDDLENLNAMLKCDPSFTFKDKAIQLTGDGGLQKGTLHREQGDQKPAFEPIDQKLNQLLDDIGPS